MAELGHCCLTLHLAANHPINYGTIVLRPAININCRSMFCEPISTKNFTKTHRSHSVSVFLKYGKSEYRVIIKDYFKTGKSARET